MSTYIVADPEAAEIWGYVFDVGGKPVFHQCADEDEARAAVRPTDIDGKPVSHFRKLAKRTLGPVQVVED